MTQMISQSECGFLSGPSIFNIIRLVLDLLDCSERIEDEAYILLLDFCKAFDFLKLV